MLGLIQGLLISKNSDTNQLVVLAGQVGYEVTVAQAMLNRVEVGNQLTLWLHTHVREDQLVLFGFETEMEKHFFRLLVSMSGLGPKTSLSLLSEHGAGKLAELILSKNVSQISEAPGVGKKLASRIVLELFSKVEKLSWIEKLKPKAGVAETAPIETTLRDDLASALLHLGFSTNQIRGTLEKIWESGSDQGFESLLKTALNDLSVHSKTVEMTHG